MSQSTFTIAYDGPALHGHSMDVRDLAPAMLGLGQLFDAANQALNGDGATIKVQVRATEAGSFQVVFEVVQTFVDHAVSLLTGQSVTAAVNLQGLLFGGGGIAACLIGLIKWLRGRKPDRVERLADNMVRISIGEETVDIPIALLRLYQDVAVRTATERVIAEPLRKDGITSFAVKDFDHTIAEVTDSEAEFFARPELPDEVLVDEVRRSAFSIISLAFKEDNKWRLNDGGNMISAVISDRIFLDKVDANQIAFAKGDILICDVRIVQRRTDQGLKSEYTVMRVVEHRPGVRQLPLPFHTSGPDSRA